MASNNEPDRVDDILNSFRDAPVPEGPSIELVNQTLDCLSTSSESNTFFSQFNQRLIMAQASKYRGVIAASAIVAALLGWVGFTNHSSGIAFAEVKQELQKLRTVRYVDTRLAEYASDDIEELRQIERKEIKVDPKRVFRTAGNAHQPRIIRISGRHLQRTEVLNGMGIIESITIDDLKNGKHVTLVPKEKKYVEVDTHVTMTAGSKVTTEEKVKPAPEADLFAKISEVPTDATTKLPARTIAGKQVIGFFSTQTTPTKSGTVTWERTYWVDPVSKLPVRVEVSYYGTDPRVGRSDWVLSGFVFDEDIPADQFNTEVPEGYTRETQKIHGIKID